MKIIEGMKNNYSKYLSPTNCSNTKYYKIEFSYSVFLFSLEKIAVFNSNLPLLTLIKLTGSEINSRIQFYEKRNLHTISFFYYLKLLSKY